MRKYDCILFDLDNTLVDDDENRKYAIKEVAIVFNLSINNEMINYFPEYDNNYWTMRAKGEMPDPVIFDTKDEQTVWVRAHRFEMFFSIPYEVAVKVNEVYCELIKERVIPIFGAKEAIEDLKKMGCQIFIATNGPKIAVKDKLSKIDVFKYIDETFAAEEIGFMKPKKEYFDGLFQKIDRYSRDTMLMVGDEFDKDVIGAINNGIDACWFNPNCEQNDDISKATYVIKELPDLVKILKR